VARTPLSAHGRSSALCSTENSHQVRFIS